MARAPSYQQERKNTNKKPYANSNHPCSSSSASGSISKLKGSLRSAKRLLLKDGLDAALRVETERRVESLQAELKEAEAKRPSSTTSKQDNEDGKSKAKAAATNASTESKKPKGSSSKDQIKKNEKRQNVYKMLRHVEYQKTRRRFKTASKELASIAEKLQALDTNRESMDETASKTDKKARKSLEKQLAAREEDVLRARIDSWYVNTFPADKKYVALFPGGSYVEHPYTLPTVSVSDISSEKDVLELLPSNKKPDEVRSFWRAIVHARLDQGVLTGEPKEKKKVATADKKQQSSREDAEAQQPEDDGEVEDETSSSSDSSEASETGAVDLDEGDDFFA